MNILNKVDSIRLTANDKLDPSKKGELGQFYTAAPISIFMASLFETIEGDIQLLDPGCGPCSLTAAFTDEVIKRQSVTKMRVDMYEVEKLIEDQVLESVEHCVNEAKSAGIEFKHSLNFKDFIENFSRYIKDYSDENVEPIEQFTHVIMNPPYKKIASSSDHRTWLRDVGIETVNLYSGFVSLALKRLVQGGELVAIIPRSFCNGPYYQPFREQILKETAIKHIHIFDSRNNAFAGDAVLQENIIIHLVKGEEQGPVRITSSPVADFHLDEESSTVTASDMTTRTVPFTSIVNPNDQQQFIHIAANNRDQLIIDKLATFTTELKDLNIQVSTGPVVGFRMRDDLRQDIETGAVPLIYPQHLKGGVNWPIDKKPNAIFVSNISKPWLWKHEGHFVIVKRFSSKEEKRRIVATPYDSCLSGDMIGFENKLNVFHSNKVGMDKQLALGLYVYLNCSLLDKYYRLFGGHTQVNATDLRTIKYPSADMLRAIGSQVESTKLTQKEIDQLIEKEISKMTGDENNNPLAGQDKLEQTLEILKLLGMPKAQQNERSALTFLALLNLHPEGNWQDLEKPMLGVTPIMDWCRDVYGKEYAPNTRETFRRQTLHQFVDGGLVLYNPDKPDRPVNSPKACYQITHELFDILLTFDTPKWKKNLKTWLSQRETLAAQYAMEREMQMIPLTLDDGTNIKLSPGIHSQLIHDIVVEFGPRFAPGAEVIYLGDTGAKEDFFKKDRLAELGVTVDRKGKLPDVVLYWPERDWLLLIESVTSHGPVDGKRHSELAELFKHSNPGLVYVTAFPDRKIMGKYLGDISWETEVWVAEAPTHMIHFNGDRFLGPH
ncbi:Eco57I restriction-modification methylase domain-containing protein [Pseudoalteromonas sp. SR44-5]|uniref:BsuBI/PstI family type II restriction endonuclease n=1 Tax=Pseudoalteromonas sp. SR44-5 TaxID=2760934 RepID=UPI0016021023|nr:BsuBI/PstI family type II restriction endonuclease [Pseudoalteromonas sp. SR44-5]MBB1368985.1 Eco57I restriction-modification methylase domain-containing protein [Pseudoalteromonas sp. SR44-5]